MILAVVRHGETDYNKSRLVQGRMDNPLNETGREQARNLSKILIQMNEKFDVIISSPLKRAYETACIISDTLNVKVDKTDSNFLERDFGPFEGKLVKDVMSTITQDDFYVEGYETNAQLMNRINDAVNQLYQKYSNDKVLIVAHAHVIRALLLLSDPNRFNWNEYYIGNLSTVYFNVNDNKITFIKQIDL
ncbi:histidine phosphatase family protein [Acholeplasma equifetale]|uniref:histidine phosphatase family protein n=1 Tax=Acholeplasma equifetale TaxID=264634 RepID=UPI00068A29B2|nr:histidine phosphatase family protein [Acholeplasma equifetale]